MSSSCRFLCFAATVTVAGLLGLGAAGAAAGKSGAAVRHVQALDACDPATFNAAVGPGTCTRNGGGLPFDQFVGQLQKHGRAGRVALQPWAAHACLWREPAGNEPWRGGPHLHRGRQLRRRLRTGAECDPGPHAGAGVLRTSGSSTARSSSRERPLRSPGLRPGASVRVPDPPLDADHRHGRLNIKTGEACAVVSLPEPGRRCASFQRAPRLIREPRRMRAGAVNDRRRRATGTSLRGW